MISWWLALLVYLVAAPGIFVRAMGDLRGPTFDLVFDYGYDLTPDCVQRQPLVRINDMWPPPTLHVGGHRVA